MNNPHNPDVQPEPQPHPDEAIQPSAADFVETPDVPTFVAERDMDHLPVWLYILCGFALFMAGSSFTGFGTFGLGLYDTGPGAPVLSSSQTTEVAVTDPITLGKKIYNGNCANCHHADGAGQPGVYPPMGNSEWVVGSKERLAAILLKGLQGPLTVAGGSYGSAVMPAQETVLTPDKIANLMTYIRGSWGNKAGPVTADEVSAAADKYKSHPAAWSEAELLKIAPHGPDPTDKK